LESISATATIATIEVIPPTATSVSVEIISPTEIAEEEIEIVPVVSSTATSSPTLTAIPAISATVTATATLTQTATAIPFVNEPALMTLVTDDFELGELFLWTASKNWSFAQVEGGTVLQSTTGVDPLTFAQTNMLDVSATIQVQLNGGSMAMHLRESGAGRYSVILNANGILALYRDTTLLEGTSLALLGTEWHSLTLSAMGDILRVKVDDVTLLAVQDSAPLSAGGLSIASVDGSPLRVDDFELAVPEIAQVTSIEVLPTNMPTALPTFTPPPETGFNVKQANPQSLQLQPMMAGVFTIGSTTDLISTINSQCTNTMDVVEFNLVSVSGTYTLISPITSTHGDSGLPVIKCNLTINGDPDNNGTGSTITRDSSKPFFRILMVDEGASLTLNDLTITNGKLDSGGGAGIASYYGNLTLNNVTLEHNVLYYGSGFAIRGAGIAIYHGQLNIQNSRIINNINQGYPLLSAVDNVRGGGIAIDNGNDDIESNIIDTLISGNVAAHGGGGIYAEYATLNIQRSTFENNSTFNNQTPVGGAGIFVGSGSNFINIQNSLFQNNDAATSGDAIYNLGPNPSIHNSCVIDNNDGTADVVNWHSSSLGATENWWGHTGGPGQNQVSGNVDTNSYINYQPNIPDDCLNGFPEPPNPVQEYYEMFKGIMFWAIYNESNSNEHIPLHSILPNATTTIQNTIFEDHRYVMARLLLNNIPLNDVDEGVAVMRRWGGSINNPSYELWRDALCPSVGYYQSAYDSGSQSMLNWFNEISECNRNEENFTGFNSNYLEIMSHLDTAIQHHLDDQNYPNPVPNADFVKHTSSCFVWHRDESGNKTSCRAGTTKENNGRIDMQVFCNQIPNRPANPVTTNRNCRNSSINPQNINATEWIATPEGRDSNQQLGLETVVGTDYFINLGLYTPDQPIDQGNGQWTSGLGCEDGCYFLLGNPVSNSNRVGTIPNESVEDAWIRHQSRHENFDFGYKPDGQTKVVHVLWNDVKNIDNVPVVVAQTWITYAFQND